MNRVRGLSMSSLYLFVDACAPFLEFLWHRVQREEEGCLTTFVTFYRAFLSVEE